MKYRFEGFICVGVFAAGVIWSRLIFPSVFWKVDNIHDLFEMLGVVATIIAASVAVSALNGWKGQFAHTEKYRLIRDFHGACQGAWNGYWYVSHGFGLIDQAWGNRGNYDWLHDELEIYRTALVESRRSLESAFFVLKHHLSGDDLERFSEVYHEYMNQVSYGGSEIIAYNTRCRAMIAEPVDLYGEYLEKGIKRLELIDKARTDLCDTADYLLAKYAQPT
ncbi:hypothetical protein ACIP01_06240 [Pseudomonas monteilii]|uniref:hypothetical protein n=1 Tax=Pseudomonas monteilii TaxID=76759 RepID=UPI003806F60A